MLIVIDSDIGERIEAALRGLGAKRQEVETNCVSYAMGRRARALPTAAELAQRVNTADVKRSFGGLTAPIDDTVQYVKVCKAGIVITTDKVLMTIVHDACGIDSEASAAGMYIGFTHGNQAAKIKLEAFPSTHHWLVHDTVRPPGRNSDRSLS